MKVVFLFLLISLAWAETSLVSLNSECPEQHVSDPSRICIRPDYIEGCELYLNTKECFKCSKGTLDLR